MLKGRGFLHGLSHGVGREEGGDLPTYACVFVCFGMLGFLRERGRERVPTHSVHQSPSGARICAQSHENARARLCAHLQANFAPGEPPTADKRKRTTQFKRDEHRSARKHGQPPTCSVYILEYTSRRACAVLLRSLATPARAHSAGANERLREISRSRSRSRGRGRERERDAVIRNRDDWRVERKRERYKKQSVGDR